MLLLNSIVSQCLFTAFLTAEGFIILSFEVLSFSFLWKIKLPQNQGSWQRVPCSCLQFVCFVDWQTEESPPMSSSILPLVGPCDWDVVLWLLFKRVKCSSCQSKRKNYSKDFDQLILFLPWWALRHLPVPSLSHHRLELASWFPLDESVCCPANLLHLMGKVSGLWLGTTVSQYCWIWWLGTGVGSLCLYHFLQAKHKEATVKTRDPY